MGGQCTQQRLASLRVLTDKNNQRINSSDAERDPEPCQQKQPPPDLHLGMVGRELIPGLVPLHCVHGRSERGIRPVEKDGGHPLCVYRGGWGGRAMSRKLGGENGECRAQQSRTRAAKTLSVRVVVQKAGGATALAI